METTKITYLKGDATRPLGESYKLITHVCNDVGAWGAGFVLAVSRRWVTPEYSYRKLKTRVLGDIQEIAVERDISVVNMIAQRGLRKGIPLSYPSLSICLHKVFLLASARKASVHMPRIGCGLAGGDWKIVEKIIEDRLTIYGISVTVYDL